MEVRGGFNSLLARPEIKSEPELPDVLARRAAASRALLPGRPAVVVARLNRTARRALLRARRARLRVRVTLPGAPAVDRTVTLVR